MRNSTCCAVLALLLSLFPATLNAQCMVSCPTTDQVAVQAQLDATAAAGGGVVQLEPRVYPICTSLIVGSNTHLRGAGRGATVVHAVTGYIGRTVSNSYVSSLIGSVGSNNVTISDMTVEISTCAVHANVVSLLPTSISPAGAYDGVPVTNALVERLEILGTPGFHSYMLWNLKGEGIKFLNNWIDGNSTTDEFAQEGMESYGGRDVLMDGNTVTDIGNACITLGAGNIVDSDTEGLRVVNNHLKGCTVGIDLTASGVFNGESMAATLVSGNDITGSREVGIDVAIDYGAYERALHITANTIIGVSESLASGIRLRSNGTSLPIPSANVAGTTVAMNYVADVTGANSFGIYATNYPGADILNNTVTNTASDGIRVYNARDTWVMGNKITGAGNAAIGVYRTGSLISERVLVEGNRAFDWSPLTSAIFVTGTSRGTVRDNKFSRSDAATPSPINITSSSCGFKVSGNEPWYLASYTQPTSPACP